MLEFERFLIGGRIGAKLPAVRLEALFPADQINKFAEEVAVRAGAELLVTAEREEALRWLLEGSDDEASENGR